jgi:hypothetical protein
LEGKGSLQRINVLGQFGRERFLALHDLDDSGVDGGLLLGSHDEFQKT